MTLPLPWENAKQFIDSGVKFSYQETPLYYELVYFVGSTQYQTIVDKTDPKNTIQLLFETVYIPLASVRVFSELSFFPSPLSTKQTYSVSVSNFVPGLLATDIMTVAGSALKTIYINKIKITGTRTAHNHDLIILLKRTSIDVGGIFITRQPVSYDSDNANSVAVVRTYTTNPVTLGSLFGQIYSNNLSLPVKTPSNSQGNGAAVIAWEWSKSENGQPITLRGPTENIALNLNGVTIAGGLLNITIEWSEE